MHPLSGDEGQGLSAQLRSLTEQDTTDMNVDRVTLLAISVAITLALTGCFDKLNGPYDGEDKIGFAFDLVAQAEQDNEPAGRLARGDTTYTVELPTELIGPQRSSSVEVNFSTLQERRTYEREVPTDTGGTRTDSFVLAEPTTAEEGTHYELPQGDSFTLPSDSSTANVEVQVLDGLDAGDDPVRLTVKIDGNEAENLLPAERFRYYALELQPPQP